LDILFQFISNSLKFERKPSNVLKENVDKILSICIMNESNKHLRIQSLNGFYYLIQYEGLVENNAQKLDTSQVGEIKSDNLQFIAYLVWHSLWTANNLNSLNTDDTLQEEER
jgi:hypothetical protein